MSDPWLTEEQQRAWRALQRLRLELMGHLGRRLLADSGVSEAEYSVLVALSEHPERRMRMRELALTLTWEKSRLSHLLARMEARGMVRREKCTNDLRGFDVLLTDQGFATIESAAPQHALDVRHCFADLLNPEQLRCLAEIGDIVSAHLAAEHRGNCSEPPCVDATSDDRAG